jgi:predicted PurR-regulated permease PerM
MTADPVARPEGGQFYARVFALGTAAVLGFAVFRIVQPFLGAIFWSILLAFLLWPVNARVRRGVGERRGLAAILLTVSIIVVLAGPAAALAVAFANQAADLVQRVQASAGKLEAFRPGDLLQLPVVRHVVDWVGRFVPISADDIQQGFVRAASAVLAFIVANTGTVVRETFSTILTAVVTLFLLFFFLRDGEQMVARALRRVPLEPARRVQLLEHVSAVTRAVVFGSLVTALVQGALLGIGFAVIGLPSPVVFGVLAAVASLIPFVGTALVWVPGAAALLLQGRWGAALFLAIWSIAIVGTADNFVRPLFISGRAEISTLPAFLGLAGGLSAFGLIGLVLGPVVVALVLALVRFADEASVAVVEP